MMLLSLLLLGVLFIAGLLYLLFYPPSAELPHPRPWQPVQDNSANNSPPIGERMDDGEKAELERVFAAFDKDGDGVLSEQELRESLHNIGIFMTDKHVKEVMEKLDANGDGSVDIKEFCEMFKASQEGAGGKHGVETRTEDEREVEMKEAFDVFDKNGDGLISVEELGKILLGFGLKEGEKMEDCREMIRRVDMDGDGMVNFDEFRRMMKSGGKLFTGF